MKTIVRFQLCITAIAFFLFSQKVNAQLVVNNATNATEAVQNYLLGEGITATGITFSGNNDQIASFTCTGCNLGLAEGVVMSSGNAGSAIGPNGSGSTSESYTFGASDPDLALLANAGLNDAAVLQFDFVPTGDSLAFNFVFGSDEYPEYSNSGFNDSFGFFLSGPGIDGPYTNDAINIALIPGTTIPVTINNLNNGSTGTNGPCEYCQYYISNNIFNSDANIIECDGFTTVLTAFANVQCGETYHIKLAIADAGDASFNSWVFLESGSFQSNQVQVDFEVPEFAPSDSSVYEGCEPANLTFTRPSTITEEQSFDLSFGGTAINGIDYFLVGQTLTFLEGDTTVSLPVWAYQDGIIEGTETIEITIVSSIACIGNTAIILAIEESNPLNIELPDVDINCGEIVTLNPEISGGVGMYEIVWGGGETDSSIIVSPVYTTTYTYIISDTCMVEPLFGTVTVNVPEYPTLNVNAGPDQALDCLDDVNLSALVTGGWGPYEFEWMWQDTVLSIEPDVTFNTNQSGTVFISIIDQCGATDSDAMEISFPLITVEVDLGNDEDADCLTDIFINSDVDGGAGNLTYQWTVNGEDYGNAQSISYFVDAAATIVLTVSDECGNEGEDEMIVTIDPANIDFNLGATIVATCLDVINFNPNVEGGAGTITWLWEVDGQNAGSSTSLSVEPDGTTLVELTITDQCGTQETDNVTIEVPPVPVVLDLTNDHTICPDVQTTLDADASGGVGTLIYDWNPGTQTGTSINVTPDETTTYSITVEDECGNEAQQSVVVEVLEFEPLIIKDDFEVCVGVTEEGLHQGGMPPYNIDFESQYLSIEEGQIVQGESPVTSTIITVTDFCGNSAEVTVFVSSCNTIVPNIFTPNGDALGLNNVFYIEGLIGYPNSTLTVFNRWGKEVYKNENYNNTWNGSELEDGVYFYTFARSDGEGYEGYVTIVR